MDGVFYTMPEVARRLGLAPTLLNQYVREMLIVPANESKKGAPACGYRLIDVPGALATGLVASLRRKGASNAEIRPISLLVCSLTCAELDAAIARGDVLLVSGNGGDETPAQLVPETAAVLSRSDGLRILSVDIERAYERLVADLPNWQVFRVANGAQVAPANGKAKQPKQPA